MTCTQLSALDLSGLARLLLHLSTIGRVENPPTDTSALVVSLGLGLTAGEELIATAHLFALGPCRDETSLLRRALTMLPDYRNHLLFLLREALASLPDDETLGDTLERLDHLGPELLELVKAPVAHAPGAPAEFGRWDVAVWQAPDAITLLARVVAAPDDLPERPQGPNPAVPLDWWTWKARPKDAAPAPWGDASSLDSALAAARHPFWGPLVATLDACTGDYPWQSLDVRSESVRSRHVRLGPPAEVLGELWREVLKVYPAAPLIPPSPPTPRPRVQGRGEDLWSPLPRVQGRGEKQGSPLPGGARGEERVDWFRFGIDRLAAAKVAAEVGGSWRLHEDFRKEMLRDDDHMLAYEALRQRAYQLARAAEERASTMKKAVPA